MEPEESTKNEIAGGPGCLMWVLGIVAVLALLALFTYWLIHSFV